MYVQSKRKQDRILRADHAPKVPANVEAHFISEDRSHVHMEARGKLTRSPHRFWSWRDS